jgi:hypothetical protein
MSNSQKFLFLGLILLSTGCGTTVLTANFNGDAVGAPPAAAQSVGTVISEPGSGSITVVAAPPGVANPSKWVRISHPATPTPETSLRANATQFGPGKYVLINSLFMPSGAAVATVQFETFNGSASFLHLDFMPQGDVRIDDDESLRFGSFPRDQPFVLTVTLTITNASATAHIGLLGGASGTKDIVLKPAVLNIAKQFGSIRFWVGFQHKTTFFADDIVMKRE